ncbi:asparagine synthase (glutamine-hydrolyzing) [candidate division KSB1 bacterium]|nr:asparagine synthase (glutamine-hydrolyzing) [candidate division KSB1 bacterium]
MCGIAGIVGSFSETEAMNQVRNMIRVLRHRGPDEFGIYRDTRACLGHARLSIIDLATGSQPMTNEDRSLWIVFNGEIFNYPELREKLLKKGHHFKTTSDTEVLLHGYEEFGVKLLEKLNGQFAFAIWDSKKEECFIARDRVGIRPLFYTLSQGSLFFASEIKALLCNQTIPAEFDFKSLIQIFTLWTTLPQRTIFKNICQLPPGHFLIWKGGKVRIQKYWQLQFPAAGDYADKSVERWAEEFRHLLIDASLIRLRADVPVGAYLSGGLDSSVVTAIIRHYTSNDLRTFSISFEERTFDESDFQKLMIEHLQTNHSNHRVLNREIYENFRRALWHIETPILRTAPVPLMMLSKLVRENRFKVVLTGEGADEFLGGYNIFKETKVRHFWAKFPQSELRPLLLQKLYPYLRTASARNRRFMERFFAKDLTDTGNPVYSHLIRWHNTAMLRAFLADDVAEQYADYDPVEEYKQTLPAGFNQWHAMSKAQYIEVDLFMSGYLLSSQGDRMAMANSVEGRFPFLDHRLIEFATGVPPKLKLHVLNEKYLLKKAMGDLLPEQIFTRPKQPYRAPIAACFFSQSGSNYVKDLFNSDSIIRASCLQKDAVSKLLKKWEHLEGKLQGERENMAFVSILSLLSLHELFIVGNHSYLPQNTSDFENRIKIDKP